MKKLCVCFLLLFNVVLAAKVMAASSIEMNLENLVEMADDIVVARVSGAEGRWENNKIVTDSTLSIVQQVKGDPKSQLVITTLGGVATHPRLHTLVEMHVPGNVRFDNQEEVLVFSKRSRSGLNQVIGLSQGKLTIELDESGEKVIAVGRKMLANQHAGNGSFGIFFEEDSLDGHRADINLHIRKIYLSEMLKEIEKFL